VIGEKYLPGRIYNFCPYCGKQLPRSDNGKTNFCSFCGKKLKKDHEKFLKKVQCTVCHQFINPSRQTTIKCSFCESIYHSTCVSSWLIKYNACPMCQNVFILPNKILPLAKN